MAFRSVLGVTGADHSDQDVRTAASLCAEVGAYLSVLVMSPPPLAVSPPPLGDGIPEWPGQRAHAIAALEKCAQNTDAWVGVRSRKKVVSAQQAAFGP